jgi:glyceraldehyde-3-phosphate dehydrogenase/erythrose-4-phosphate dehydrogenase
MSTQQESRNRSTESVMATHGSSRDADLPIPSKETCPKESLHSEATVLEDLSNAFSGTTTFQPTSMPSALSHALSPNNPSEAEEVSMKINQATGEEQGLRSIYHLTELLDVIRDFHKAFYHQNGSEKLEPRSITAERNVAKNNSDSK